MLAEMIVAAFIFSPSQMAELLTNILLSHRNHFLLFLDLACELSARPSKSSPITQTSVLPKALETDHPRGRAPPLVLLDSQTSYTTSYLMVSCPPRHVAWMKHVVVLLTIFHLQLLSQDLSVTLQPGEL